MTRTLIPWAAARRWNAWAILANLNAAHNLARWLVRDAGAAEDVVQDSVLRALRYGASWRGDNGHA